ncbi:DUF4350 domain-containing protein [Mangrovimicrobium sediminis]|uniref:DUF4350 domain-containing protein n=1 Tax=Mangrovimicrobium sediminis TaxID=2562682 RepID=A0A4Z0M8G0_9GAMM|nr:DUF4350 domain-containing protein [Haliea sp. SAOS-164]TGD75821.1 DUF4350 domain-containing protein [Haliea sp. SAOS-164]
MSNRGLILLIALPAVFFLFAFLALFEAKRVENDTGWTIEAYINPHLAARQFLERLGAQVATRDSLPLDAALPAGGTVYLSQPGQVLTSAQAARLTRWMRDGGHLVLRVNAGEQDNPLLDDFGVIVEGTYCGCEVEDEASGATGEETGESAESTEEPTSLSEALRQYNEEIRAQLDGEAPAEDDSTAQEEVDPHAGHLSELTFEGVEETLTIDLGQATQLFHPALAEEWEEHLEEEWEEDFPDSAYDDYAAPDEAVPQPVYYAGSEQGVNFMQFEVGDGLLSLLAGADPFANGRIGDYDHAYLLWLLSDGNGETLLFHGAHAPSLWQLLWRHFPEAAVAALVLFVASLWAAGRRFGPVVEPPVIELRGIAEHLRASGDYQWQHGAAQALLQPLEAAVMERAQRLFPHLDQLPAQQQLDLLAQHSALPEAAIRDALYGEPPQTPGAFTERARFLQQLGEAL